MGKPRYVILAFQTNKQHNILADKSTFDHCKVQNVKIFLNNESYPYIDFNTSFDQKRFTLAYYLHNQLQVLYYRCDSYPLLSPEMFSRMTPLLVFDTSKQNERVVDCRIEIISKVNIPANTAVYCLILYYRVVSYNCFSGLVNMVS
ncbi:hypothetical protein PR048_020157 [Dryococelus australis]|uniref:Double jelly roll-like domain-containing protein n=1 Tax=Dryococelus australis TaxID=614101 RepID=A0ABQ9H5J0_9NEOP|nr:hypothetical protein PR048_020157 [Dryococelus australis]